MSDFPLIIQKDNFVLRIVFNRATKGNIINSAMAQELIGACRDINGDENVRVVLITAKGKDFCLGRTFEQSSIDKDIIHYKVAGAIGSIEKPVITAIQGKCLGQGLEIALASDIRFATSSAQFGFPWVAQGRIPSDGGSQRLPRIIGRGKALELLLNAAVIDAKEAELIGLVSKVYGNEVLIKETEQFATELAQKAPVALRYIKEAVNKGLDLTEEQGLRLEADLYFLLHTTADRTEGITSFLKKRVPDFKGK